jgi:hypothetical protein
LNRCDHDPSLQGGARAWDFAADKLVEYEAALVARGLEGWTLIHELLGDDWGAPPRSVQILVNGKIVAAIPYG